MGHVNCNTATQPKLLSWQEVVAILQSCNERGVPKPFAIAFYTCDKPRKKGGECIRYEKAVWHVAGGRIQKTESFERVSSQPARPKRARKKSPNSKWCWLIRGFNTNEKRTVFLHLITEINGHPVK